MGDLRIEVKFKFGADKVHTEVWTYDERDAGDVKNWTDEDWEEALGETEPELVSVRVLED